MKIMIFPGGYFPGTKYGGILTSKENFVELFGDDIEIRIVAPDHDYGQSERYKDISDGWNKVGKANVYYMPEKEKGYKSFFKLIEQFRPDIIYCSGTITSYFSLNRFVLRAAKKLGIPVVITSDGDISTNALKIKKIKKYVAILLLRILNVYKDVFFQTNMIGEEQDLQKHFGIKNEDVRFLKNVPGVPRRLKHKTKNQGELKVVFISRICPIKNLIDAIGAVSLTANKNIKLDIYGPLEDMTYWENCLSEIEKLNLGERIVYKGSLDTRASKTVFNDYDCLILPTYSENYGYVIEESLLCDCPVIISKGTTPWDDLNGVAGYCEELGRTDLMAKDLVRLSEMNDMEYSELRDSVRMYVERKTNIPELKQCYFDLFDYVIERKK